MQTFNPATGSLLSTWQEHSAAEVQELILLAESRFQEWRQTSCMERSACLLCLADVLRKAGSELARLITAEMGKPITQSAAELNKCAATCDYYAAEAERLLSPELRPTEAARSYVRLDPLGVLLGVMPWNFPFWQVFRFAIPAIVGGNVVLLKHASAVTGCALAIERLFRDAGFPPGVFTTLLIPAPLVAQVIQHPLVRGVSLTGSDAAGREVAECAGRSLKKCVLELGGADPFIVLADADPVVAAKAAATARLINSGQSCIAAKRFLVDAAVAPAFEQALVAEMRAQRVGDPTDPLTQVGPLARGDLRDELHDQVQRSLAAGAACLLGGTLPAGPGFYYPPTVLTHVEPGMPAFDEEVFGPVAAVTRVQDVEEAVQLANRSRFGLGASVWSSDPAQAELLAARLEAGAVFINEITRSDPRLPFGGVRDSGYGRELAEYGLREFMNVKSVWIA